MTEHRTEHTAGLSGRRVVVVNWRDLEHRQAGGAEIYAWQYARASGLVHDEDLRRVVELATSSAGRFVGREVHDLVPGAVADLVLVDAENPMDALVRTPPRSLVMAAGKVLHGDDR